jgi:hypothetical protein
LTVAATNFAPLARESIKDSTIEIRPLLILIWSLPLLWLIGGERLMFPFLAVGLLLPRVKMGGRTLSLSLPAWWFLAFLAASFISITQISTDVRIITFVWDASIYIGFFCVLLFITKNVTEFVQIRTLLVHIVLFGVVAQLFASTYFTFGSWRYESVIGQLLPGNLRNTMIGRGVLVRAVGKELWLLGINERVKAFFSSSIHFGTVLMMVIGVSVYFLGVLKGSRWWMALALLISSAVFLLYSQSRTAMVLSVLMVTVSILVVSMARSRAFGPALVGALFAGVMLAVGAFAALFWDQVWASIQDVFIESRAASFENRTEIYRQTLEWITRQPIFGYGTQTDVPGLGYPLGSHNWYLSVLFKHGLIAFIPFIIFILSVLTCSVVNVFRRYPNAEPRILSIILTCWLGCYLALCLTIEPVVDAMHMLITACLFGIILIMPKFAASASEAVRKYRWS